MKTLTIDVVSDVVCPWCYVGKRRLEGALDMLAKEHPDVVPEVRWHAFQLNPDMKPEGIERSEYVKNKFGDRADSIYERVSGVGQDVGIAFKFDQIKRQPNTILAHSLIGACDSPDNQERMVEELFQAYFLEGRDLTDPKVLVEVAITAGMTPFAAEKCMSDEDVMQETRNSDKSARDMGVTGVPFFIFNRKLGVSGAQESESLLKAMTESVE
jgi:predicted DsbA family dithiol-disulfide isomerase